MLLAAFLENSVPDDQGGSVGRQQDECTDADLVRRLRLGDEIALGHLVDRYWEPLVRYAASYLGDVDSAEDAVQEAMVRLWGNPIGWNGSGTVRGYLYRIVRNLALQENEKREVRIRFQKADHGFPSAATPADDLERKRFRIAVQTAIAALSPRRREIFLLARFHGLTYQQIGEAMGISPQTVANQMSSAMKELRHALKEPRE